MHPDLHPYPLSLPTQQALAIVINLLRRQSVDLKEAAHCAWHVAGYALSKWDMHMTGRFTGKAIGSWEEAADQLEAVGNGADEDTADWKGIYEALRAA